MNLDPIPSATPGPPPGAGDNPATGAKSPASKANYEAYRPKYGDRQSLSRKFDASPEPTPRSAQGRSSSSSDQDEVNPLDNLPPIELPSDLTRRGKAPSATSGGVAPPAESLAAKAAEPLPLNVAAAPGIQRFSGVGLKLAGGSLPTSDGLEWLVDKGYKTILDLREDSQLAPSFVAEAARRGLRYVALPVSAKTIDADHVDRFLFELSLSEARPLYFCDTDGTRAGTLWYIRRVIVDKVDPLVAKRDAEELGLADAEFWDAANAYLARRSSAPTPVTPPSDNPGAAASPKPVAEPRSDTPPNLPATTPTPAGNVPSAPSAGPAPKSASREEAPASGSHHGKSIAALVATALGVPIAYASSAGLGRASIRLQSWTRASLPAARIAPRALPDSSGA